jgi:predicted  nucleic acid-binding Zn-ribbon protein
VFGKLKKRIDKLAEDIYQAERRKRSEFDDYTRELHKLDRRVFSVSNDLAKVEDKLELLLEHLNLKVEHVLAHKKLVKRDADNDNA